MSDTTQYADLIASLIKRVTSLERFVARDLAFPDPIAALNVTDLGATNLDATNADIANLDVSVLADLATAVIDSSPIVGATLTEYTDWCAAKVVATTLDYAIEFNGDITTDYGQQQDFATGDTPAYDTLHDTRQGINVGLNVNGGTDMDNRGGTTTVAFWLLIPDSYTPGPRYGMWSNGAATNGQGGYLDDYDIVLTHKTSGTFRDTLTYTLPGPGLYCIGMRLQASGSNSCLFVNGVKVVDQATVTTPNNGTDNPRIGDSRVSGSAIDGSGLVIGRFIYSSSPADLSDAEHTEFYNLTRPAAGGGLQIGAAAAVRTLIGASEIAGVNALGEITGRVDLT